MQKYKTLLKNNIVSGWGYFLFEEKLRSGKTRKEAMDGQKKEEKKKEKKGDEEER